MFMRRSCSEQALGAFEVGRRRVGVVPRRSPAASARFWSRSLRPMIERHRADHEDVAKTEDDHASAPRRSGPRSRASPRRAAGRRAFVCASLIAVPPDRVRGRRRCGARPGRPSAPGRGRLRCSPSRILRDFAADHVRIVAHDPVGALLDRDGSLGVRAQREARHAEHGRLFLDAARVGQHEARVRHQAQEVEIAERRRSCAARASRPPSRVLDRLRRARVHREDDGQPLRGSLRARRRARRAAPGRRRCSAGAA